ncbi:MAG TPA: SDR family oxidoreductase [Longimicrobiaceae bacterium]
MIAITGVTGHLGRLVVEELLASGVSASDIVGLARSPDRAESLRERGVEVRRADYTEPESLSAALAGVDRLLLVSANEVGQRLAQHRNVIDAARAAGVGLLAYTSILRADRSTMQLAVEHAGTEEAIRESGIPYTFLRNSWYIENYTENLAPALEHGVLLGSAGEGRVSAATRRDYAAAAAAVIRGSGHEGKVYELGGDEAFTMAELAEEISRASKRTVEYRDLPEEEYVRALVGFGLPEPAARALADSDRALARGELYTDSGDLRRLIGRATKGWREVVREAVETAVAGSGGR